MQRAVDSADVGLLWREQQVVRLHCAAVLGVRLVVVLGARQGIDSTVRAAGGEVRYVEGQRVTDAATMDAAVQAAGAARMEFEARLSKASPALLSCSPASVPVADPAEGRRAAHAPPAERPVLLSSARQLICRQGKQC